MFLINISSNHRQKFFIGSALNLLSDYGDMYVSDVFKSSDRQGGNAEFYNCCLQLTTSMGLEELTTKTKEIEAQLGRKPNDKSSALMPIDIDILAHKQQEADTWAFLEKRLPLTQDVIWGLSDLTIDFTHVDINNSDTSNRPKPENWWQ